MSTESAVQILSRFIWNHIQYSFHILQLGNKFLNSIFSLQWYLLWLFENNVAKKIDHYQDRVVLPALNFSSTYLKLKFILLQFEPNLNEILNLLLIQLGVSIFKSHVFFKRKTVKTFSLVCLSHSLIFDLLCIWVNCYCWGNSSMVEGRFSKWF